MTMRAALHSSVDEPPARQLKSRLRQDLALAMRSGAKSDVGVLRTLLAAIDNAEAVQVGDVHYRYVVRQFLDRSAEVPRRDLSHNDLQDLIRRDRDERLRVAADVASRGRMDRARELRREAALVSRYILD